MHAAASTGSATAEACWADPPARFRWATSWRGRRRARPGAGGEFGLVGLNGVDFIARRGVPYPIEVNPRYSASMELIERAHGSIMFEIHSRPSRGFLPTSLPAQRWIQGKAIVFARQDVSLGDTRPGSVVAGWRTCPTRASGFAGVTRSVPFSPRLPTRRPAAGCCCGGRLHLPARRGAAKRGGLMNPVAWSTSLAWAAAAGATTSP